MKSKKTETVIMDRDGVINKLKRYKGNLISPQSLEEFRYIEDSKEALNTLEKQEIDVYVVSNQPDISKSWRKLNKKRLKEINHKLKLEGVEKVYNCTHGPKGNRKNKKYKDKDGNITVCNCRKPQPGLIEKCYQENTIKTNKAIFIGDKETDIKAATRFEQRYDREFQAKILITEQTKENVNTAKNLKNAMDKYII